MVQNKHRTVFSLKGSRKFMGLQTFSFRGRESHSHWITIKREVWEQSNSKVELSLFHELCLIKVYWSPCTWPEAQQPTCQGEAYLFLSLRHYSHFLAALDSWLSFWVLLLLPFLTLQWGSPKEKVSLSPISQKHHPPKEILYSNILRVPATPVNDLKLTLINPHS